MGSKFHKKDSWARTKASTEGVSFLVLTLIIGFAAFNTGNNLLYLIFGLTLSLVAISGVIAMINISKIDLYLESSSDLYALTPGHLWFRVKNSKKVFSSYSVVLTIQDKKYFIDKIKSENSITIKAIGFFNKRGLNEIPQVTLSSTYPFGFFKKWLRTNNTEELIVFPKIYNIDYNPDPDNSHLGNQKPIKNGNGTEIRSLKKYNIGDNIKDIHWKVSAKLKEIHTKEYFSETTNVIKLSFSPDKQNSSELEKYINKTASIFYKLVHEGYEVEFITKNKIYYSNEGKNSYKNVFRFLALYGN